MRVVLCAIPFVFLVVGCARSPEVHAQPNYDPDTLTTAAFAEYDRDKNGFIEGAELDACPGLKAALPSIDTNNDKKLSADELKGGSFTISNPGRFGNLYGFAIINQPQVGILRMGEIVKRPVVRTVGGEDAIVIRPIMHLALSYDHRAVDGAPANGFLHRIRELLEEAEFDL